MIKKIILFDGETETLAFFSYQMRDEFLRLGYEVYTFSLDHFSKSLGGLMRFIRRRETALVTFNFHGLSPSDYFFDEDSNEWFWDAMEIPCYNIVVDHPFYYYQFFEHIPKNYIHLSIDWNHDAYMQRFYPGIKRFPFLALAGTHLDPRQIDAFKTIPNAKINANNNLCIKDRPIDIVLTGNLIVKQSFEKYITQNGPEYEAFYREIIQDVISDPQKTSEEVIEEHIRREIPNVTMDELRFTLSKLIFVEMYARAYFREKAVRELVDHGLKVHILGGGWDLFECKHPENLFRHDNTDSKQCLEMLQMAKMSLNVMPWFKNGAHDRVFNTMLNGGVLLTDTSLWMNSFLRSGENCIVFPLENMDAFSEQVNALIGDTDTMQSMADEGYKTALPHTWASRVREIDIDLKRNYG